MKKKQLTIMLGAMTLALLLGTAPVVQNVAAAGLPVSISQKAKQDALEHADIIDSLKKGSVAIRKYDMTAAQAAGDYSEDMWQQEKKIRWLNRNWQIMPWKVCSFPV